MTGPEGLALESLKDKEADSFLTEILKRQVYGQADPVSTVGSLVRLAARLTHE